MKTKRIIGFILTLSLNLHKYYNFAGYLVETVPKSHAV